MKKEKVWRVEGRYVKSYGACLPITLSESLELGEDWELVKAWKTFYYVPGPLKPVWRREYQDAEYSHLKNAIKRLKREIEYKHSLGWKPEEFVFRIVNTKTGMVILL